LPARAMSADYCPRGPCPVIDAGVRTSVGLEVS
jgi:hypothetical protein